MNHWTYLGKVITCIDDIENNETITGFVYRITNILDGREYYGKKILQNTRKTRISKREKTLTPTRKVFKRVCKESNWKDYYGSCKPLLEEMKIVGKENFKREILEFCCTKKYLSYCEVFHQVKNDVLKTNSYNGNIMNRWFQKDMNNCFKDE